MFTRAGKEIIKANKSFLIPLAALINRSTRPILNTRTTRRSVGDTDRLSNMSSKIIAERQI